MIDTSTAPAVRLHSAAYADYRSDVIALAAWLNEQKPQTWGDLKALLAVADEQHTTVRLVSLRGTRWSGRRDLMSFDPVRFSWETREDAELPEVSYLYDDGVNHGRCKVSNLKRVARWEAGV